MTSDILLQNLHSAKQMRLLCLNSSKLQSRQSSVNHILQSHVPLLSPLIEKCKSLAEPLVTSRQTLASHSSAQTLLPDIWRSQSVRLESTKPSSWLNLCAEYRTTHSTCRTYRTCSTELDIHRINITNMILFFHLNGNCRDEEWLNGGFPICFLYGTPWSFSFLSNVCIVVLRLYRNNYEGFSELLYPTAKLFV